MLPAVLRMVHQPQRVDHLYQTVHDGLSRRPILKDAIPCTDRELTDNDDRFSVQAIFEDRGIGLGQ